MLKVTTAFNGSSRLGNKLLVIAGCCVVARILKLQINSQELLKMGSWLERNNWGHKFLENFTINEKYLNGERIDEPVIKLTQDFVESNIDVERWKRGQYHIEGDSLMVHSFILKYCGEYKDVYNIKPPVQSQEGVFVHYRGGDQPQPSVGTYEYYKKALEYLNTTSGYITTDRMSFEEPMVNQLVREFNLKKVPIDYSPIDTLLFARGFNYMVLDRGSYSWWLGTFTQPKKAYCYIPPDNFNWGVNLHQVYPNWEPLSG